MVGTQALVVGHRAGYMRPCSLLAPLLSIPAVTPTAPTISRGGVESFCRNYTARCCGRCEEEIGEARRRFDTLERYRLSRRSIVKISQLFVRVWSNTISSVHVRKFNFFITRVHSPFRRCGPTSSLLSLRLGIPEYWGRACVVFQSRTQ